VSFDSTPTQLLAFTSDVDAAGAVLHALERETRERRSSTASISRWICCAASRSPGVAILLLSETVDHGSQAKVEDALRSIGDTNTAIYALGFSTAKSEAALFADRNLPMKVGPWTRECPPSPPGGCMGKDPTRRPTNKAVQAWIAHAACSSAGLATVQESPLRVVSSTTCLRRLRNSPAVNTTL